MIEIDDFYGHAALTAKLETLAESPVIDIEAIGESPEGRELWCATVAGTGGPPADSRPALFVSANMHALEFAGSWTSLHLLDRLAEGYGEVPEISDLLDRRTFYVVPRVCPDGADFVLETRTRKCRSRFVDLDPEAVRDSNVVLPSDLTGDGKIHSMRWPVADGEQVVPEDEPRLTLPRTEEETDGTYYRYTAEGIVANYDGGPVSDVDMRSDFNRNFPSGEWDPFDWIGHGPYPLSEPETRAIGEFLLDHPNVVGVADLHTGNPAIFPPQTAREDDPAHAEDADLIEHIGERGEEITDFPFIGGYYEASGDDPYTLAGTFKDWAYERTGVPTYVVEQGKLINHLGLDTDDLEMDGREYARDWGEAMLDYHDADPDRDVFYDWKTVEHPQLGEVEVGGWDWVRYGNPPIAEMPGIAERVTDWLLEFAEWAPDVGIETAAEPVDGDLHKVTATVRNRGRLPTNVTEQGHETIQDAAPLVTIDGGRVVSGDERRLLDHLDARGGGEQCVWVVRSTDSVTVTVESPRGVAAENRVEFDD